MRQLVVVAMLLVCAGEAAAQEVALRPAQRSYFGAPVVKYTTLRSQGALMFGGRGALHLSPSLAIGADLYGTLTEVNARAGAVPAVPYQLDVKFENFGFDVEYGVHPSAPTHLTLATFLGGAAARYAKDKTNEQEGETDFMLLAEPAVGVDHRVTDWLHLNVAASYRLVRGVEQPALTSSDLRGAAIALTVKMGRL